MTVEMLFVRMATQFRTCLANKTKIALAEIEVENLTEEEIRTALEVFSNSTEDLDANHRGWEIIASSLTRRLFRSNEINKLHNNLLKLRGAESTEEVVNLLKDTENLKTLMICVTINCLTKYCFLAKKGEEK